MQLAYDRSVDDLVAFNLFHSARAPTRWMHRVLDGLALVSVLVGALIAWRAHNVAPAMPLFVGAGVLGVLTVMRKSLISSAVRRQYRHAGPGLFGRHTLELEGDMLIGRTEVNETRTRVSAVGPMAETPTHVFIYVGPAAGHVIAREHIVLGDLTAFLTALRGAMVRCQEGGPTFDHQDAHRLEALTGSAAPSSPRNPVTRRLIGDIEGLVALGLALVLWAPLFSPGLISRFGIAWLLLPLALLIISIDALRAGRSFGRWAAGVALGLLTVQVALVAWVAFLGPPGH
jgi:hypothetical protein